jgi:pimeloyl-ACP methyl ester carboxylesterase
MTMIEIPQGRVEVRDSGGDGPVLLFVHGLLVNGHLWDDAVAALGADFRCVQPDLPLGAHRHPLNQDADMSPPGLARLVADLIAAMDLSGVTIVGNDTGGAITQLVLTRHPANIERVVLTNCDAYENFLPPAFRPLQWLGHVPGTAFATAQVFRARVAQRLFLKTVAHRKLPSHLLDSFARPFIDDAAVRRDATKVLKGISKTYTVEAAQLFPSFERPVLIAWGTDDRFFKPSYAERLAADFPNAQLEWIAGSRAFVPLDKPTELADAIKRFIV